MTARVASATLFVAAGVTAFAGVAGAAAPGGGNQGTVKLGSGGAFTNANDPHLQCPVSVQWSGFDAGTTQNFTVSFTGVNPTGGTVVAAGNTSGTFNGSNTHVESYSLTITGASPHHSGAVHVAIDVHTTNAATKVSDLKQKTVWLTNCGTQNGTVAVTGACNTAGNGYDWSVTATPAAAVSGTWAKQTNAAVNGAYSTGAGGTGSFSTPLGANALNLTLSTAGYSLSAATASATACAGQQNFTDSSASAAADCTALSAHLVPTNAPGGSTFTVTANGVSHSVSATNATDVSYASAAGATITVSDGATQLATAAAPAQCGQPAGVADPTVTSDKSCKNGISLTLGNMNGSADATFTVTDAKGKSHDVTVRAGQLVKKSYAVEEDTTGVVTVSAVGLGTERVRYAKDCSTVLGVKHTRHPQEPVVKGERAQLPFTGAESRTEALVGAGLLLLGSLFCGLASFRRPRATA